MDFDVWPCAGNADRERIAAGDEAAPTKGGGVGRSPVEEGFMEPIQKEQNRSNGGATTGTETSGVVEAWIGGGVDTAEAVLSSCVSILEEARMQINQRVGQTLDWA